MTNTGYIDISSNALITKINIYRPEGPIDQRETLSRGEKQFLRRFGERQQLSKVIHRFCINFAIVTCQASFPGLGLPGGPKTKVYQTLYQWWYFILIGQVCRL